MIRNSFIIFALLSSMCACSQESKKPDVNTESIDFPIQKTEAEWKAELNATQYYVLREQGTERAFSGEYNDFKNEGTFHCAACNAALFSSKTKYDSKSGWPSFYDVLNPANVKEIVDQSHGMRRTEVVCGQCGGHLGHVFEDGPQPTGLRYCINSVSLQFAEE